MDTEIWKQFYENYYISNMGRCKNIKTNKILSLEVDPHGYGIYNLQINKKNKRFKAHRMVAVTFIPNPNNYPVVNHIDCNKLNNRDSNLEWCTYSYNTKHAIANGRAFTSCLGKPHNVKLSSDDVTYIRSNPEGKTNSELAKMFGVDRKTIWRAMNKVSWQNLN